MSYKEHDGYTFLEKVLGKKSNFIKAYYQTLTDEERELLRGCMAKFHQEYGIAKAHFDAMTENHKTILEVATIMNTTTELSDGDESPRAKRANTRGVSSILNFGQGLFTSNPTVKK